MLTVKAWLWHLWRLGLAAVLLWWDVRVFAFCAFTILLMTSRQIDHLRAVVRVLSLSHDAKLIAIYERLGVTEADLVRIDARSTALLTDKQARSLKNDYALVGIVR